MATLVSPIIARRRVYGPIYKEPKKDHQKWPFFVTYFCKYLSGNLTELDQIADSSTTLKG